MTKTKQIIILSSLAAGAFGLWLYIWANIFAVRDEFLNAYTGTVTYAWRWQKLPIRIHLDPKLNLSEQEKQVIAAHFNYFFQARLHSDLIEFSSEEGENQAYIELSSYLPKEVDAFLDRAGRHSRPAIFVSKDRYPSWSSAIKRKVIMHEIGHLVGLPHFEHQDQALMRYVRNDYPAALTEVEQELIVMLYRDQIGSEVILPK